MSEVIATIEADDVVRVKRSTLIGLHHDAQSLPLSSKKIGSRFSGNYLSAFKGRGMEFDEARPSSPGSGYRRQAGKVGLRRIPCPGL